MPLIVGDAADPHVAAVVDAMRHEPVLLDAATFLETPVAVGADRLEVDGTKLSPGRAWLRRLAPAGWAGTANEPGIDGASRAAGVSALAAVLRDERFTWLTPLDQLGGAENKPFQYRRAAAFGVPVPDWVVTTDPVAVPREGRWVAKPLGPGSFIDADGNGRVVPTAIVDTRDRDTITRVPFILQRLIEAKTHARVITVSETVWSATLPAEHLPLDWRLSAEGHHGFTPVPAPDHVHSLALDAARSTGVGYTAQDWIQDTSGDWWFIDLNPAGQWLFLPVQVADSVAAAIAGFLDGAP